MLSREYVQERVWHDDESYSNTIAVRIRQLRQKVDPDGRLIHTVYGQGYVLRAPDVRRMSGSFASRRHSEETEPPPLSIRRPSARLLYDAA